MTVIVAGSLENMLLMFFRGERQSVGNQRAEVESEITTGADQPAGLPTTACSAFPLLPGRIHLLIEVLYFDS